MVRYREGEKLLEGAPCLRDQEREEVRGGRQRRALKSALSESAVVCVVWGWFFGVAPTPPKGLHHHRRTQLLRSELFVPNFVLSLY